MSGKLDLNTRNGGAAGDIIILDTGGFLDTHTVPEMEGALNTLVAAGSNKLVINMTNLEYISSAGLGVFMSVLGSVRATGGDIILCNLSEKIYKVFDMLGFTKFMKIVSTEAEALAAF